MIVAAAKMSLRKLCEYTGSNTLAPRVGGQDWYVHDIYFSPPLFSVTRSSHLFCDASFGGEKVTTGPASIRPRGGHRVKSGGAEFSGEGCRVTKGMGKDHLKVSSFTLGSFRHDNKDVNKVGSGLT